jgi:HSP20 family molecular chaperone IbpA
MQTQQTVPLKMYRSKELLTVAAPMVGLGVEDIEAELTADGRLVLHGTLCSPPTEKCGGFKGAKEVLMDEWAVGPYHREVAIDTPVNGADAKLTYGNGVVVVALPLSDRMRPARILANDARRDGGSHATETA